jgi:hypothetical protein
MDGEAITRWTVRLALAFYVLALSALLGRTRGGLARGLWTLGFLCYLAHVAAAFHYYHDWSHSAAYRATARQTDAAFGLDWGGGLWLNYLFTAAWAVDVACWWEAGPDHHRARPRSITATLHAFMAFMWFNAAIVFAPAGPYRLVALTAGTLLLFWWASGRAHRAAA